MHPRALVAGIVAGVAAAGCQTYAPAPVDLAAHARLFAERVPDGRSIQDFVERLRRRDATPHPLDLGDGLDLQEARYVALLFHPELRTLRLRAGVAGASAEHAGRWPDPVLGGDFARILEDVAHPWLAAGSLGLTLPITGRPGLEQELARSRHAQALLEARAAEARTLDALDAAWARWSAARLHADLLEDLVQRLEAVEGIANRLAAAHELSRVEARAFTLERLARQVEWMRARASVVDAELDLKQVLGLPPDRPVRFAPTLVIPERVADPVVRRERIPSSPRVAAALREHVVSERLLALAIRKQWPEMTLLPGFQEEDAQPRAALGLSLPLPLWNGNVREIAEARAAREVAAEALRGSLERATQDLVRAEARRAAARGQHDLVETVFVPLAEQQVTDGRRLAELGSLDTLLILDALTRSHEAKALAIETLLAEAVAIVEMNSLFWPTLTVGDGLEEAR